MYFYLVRTSLIKHLVQENKQNPPYETEIKCQTKTLKNKLGKHLKFKQG